MENGCHARARQILIGVASFFFAIRLFAHSMGTHAEVVTFSVRAPAELYSPDLAGLAA